jgi:hypothetical protein
VVWVLGLAAALLAADAGAVAGQRGRGGAPAGPPPTAREAAHFDLTGYWTPVITEDWRYRMVTAPRGDVRGVPLSAEGRKVAEAWDPAADAAQGHACRAYGVGGIMRMPTRLRIAWEDDWTLRIDTDAGQQTRLLRFRPEAAPGQPTWQGQSAATWEKQQLARGFGRLPAEGPGTLRVVTTNALPGYLRRNGVPYSDRAVITETFVRHADFGDEWFTVITTVEDPVYLARSFVTSTHFKREADGSGWRPAPCTVVPPLQ